ncbi:F-box domain-containing protein [Psidium guajava]|nr:F-box domain-containing protein [Psidium guajava]
MSRTLEQVETTIATNIRIRAAILFMWETTQRVQGQVKQVISVSKRWECKCTVRW